MIFEGLLPERLALTHLFFIVLSFARVEGTHLLATIIYDISEYLVQHKEDLWRLRRDSELEALVELKNVVH